jgi:hypothetical protein
VTAGAVLPDRVVVKANDIAVLNAIPIELKMFAAEPIGIPNESVGAVVPSVTLPAATLKI